MDFQRYFTKFPKIVYANNNVIDITSRVIMNDNTLKNPYLFYPYTLVEYERADQFSDRYYNDPYYLWLLYLSNKIIDPYYEWYLTPAQFNEFIELKYGSIPTALQKIKHYENNWVTDGDIRVDTFDALPPTLIKYWEPVYNPTTNKIIAYSRKKDGSILNTNNIRAYTVSNTSFIDDEICTINFDGTDTGSGQVAGTANNIVYLRHTSGVTLPNYPAITITGNSYIFGTESNVNTVFTNAVSSANNLLEEEIVYWSPVSCYDYENTRNEYNKTIQVLDSAYAAQTSKIVSGLLK